MSRHLRWQVDKNNSEGPVVPNVRIELPHYSVHAEDTFCSKSWYLTRQSTRRHTPDDSNLQSLLKTLICVMLISKDYLMFGF